MITIDVGDFERNSIVGKCNTSATGILHHHPDLHWIPVSSLIGTLCLASCVFA